MKREYADVIGPLKQLEQQVLAKGTSGQAARISSADRPVGGNDGELRNLKDRTQTDYFNTMINNLRMELTHDIQASKLDDGMDVKDELNAQDLHIKQINRKLETIQSELRKIDRTV